MLTAKQEKFCLAYVQTGNASEAYRQTYSASRMKDTSIYVNASKLMADAKVTQRIAELRKGVSDRVETDRAFVIGQLVENVRMAKQAVPVLDNEGNPTGEYRQNLNAANRALALIGKELGMFVERKEIRTGLLDGLSHDELKALEQALLH